MRTGVVGCNRLGREVARCLALSGACSGTRGRMAFIDSRDAFCPGPRTELGDLEVVCRERQRSQVGGGAD